MTWSRAGVSDLQRRSFPAFLSFAHRELSGQPLSWNWHLDAMASVMMAIAEGRSNRFISNVPPRHLKSECCSIAFVAFMLGHDPRLNFICVSYSQELAKKFSNDFRKLMHSEWYQRLFPETRVSSRKDTEAEVETTAGGGRFATSVGGTLTGRGADIIIIDDPIKAEDAQSKAERDRVGDWFNGTLLSRLNDKVKGAIVVVMQRVHVDDLAGRLWETDKAWEMLYLQAIADEEANIHLGGGRFRPRIIGEALHPAREPLTMLEQYRKSMGPAAFAAQYQQNPIQPGGNMIKLGWFSRYDRSPDILPGDGLVISWDTAFSDKSRADYSVGIVAQVRGDAVYILEVVRKRLNFPNLRDQVRDLHRRYGNLVQDYALLIEHSASGFPLIDELRTYGIFPTPRVPLGDKISRMSRPLARIEAGAVWLPKAAPWLAEFESEVMAFPDGLHDDQVDALSQLLDYVLGRKSRRARSGMLKGSI